jgi:AraC-like DNA-binding protein
MPTPVLPSGPPTLLISTDAYPERERTAVWRELYGRQIVRLEHEPLSEARFRANARLQMLPGLGIASVKIPPMRVRRTPQLLADSDDDLVLQISSTAGVAAQLGREVAVQRGEAVVFSAADAGGFTFPQASRVLALTLPRQALGNLLREPDAVLVRAVPKDTAGLRLLVGYLGLLGDPAALAAPALQRAAVTYVYDLVAVALGATRDAVEIAKGRGVRVARLNAIKADIDRNSERGDLSVNALAARHGVSPRYVQMLFEGEGTTLSKYVVGQRLARAYNMLTGPRFSELSITSVAFDTGFDDLSYFTRAFHRIYGLTPSDARAAAREREPA